MATLFRASVAHRRSLRCVIDLNRIKGVKNKRCQQRIKGVKQRIKGVKYRFQEIGSCKSLVDFQIVMAVKSVDLIGVLFHDQLYADRIVWRGSHESLDAFTAQQQAYLNGSVASVGDKPREADASGAASE